MVGAGVLGRRVAAGPCLSEERAPGAVVSGGALVALVVAEVRGVLEVRERGAPQARDGELAEEVERGSGEGVRGRAQLKTM